MNRLAKLKINSIFEKCPKIRFRILNGINVEKISLEQGKLLISNESIRIKNINTNDIMVYDEYLQPSMNPTK